MRHVDGEFMKLKDRTVTIEIEVPIYSHRIRQYRERLGITQEELANEIGKTRVHVSNLERGANFTTIETLLDLCCALKCTPNDLLI